MGGKGKGKVSAPPPPSAQKQAEAKAAAAEKQQSLAQDIERRRAAQAACGPILEGPDSPDYHWVHQSNRIKKPFPENCSLCAFGAGCFYGTEKRFWRLPGVYSTASGYIGGAESADEPTYETVHTGLTGHAEATQVVWDPSVISFADLLKLFWKCHDPTQGNRQGRDEGSQYRSAVFCTSEAQMAAAHASKNAFNLVLAAAGMGPITTEIRIGCCFHYAESKGQQYLAKLGSIQH